ncbi:MAG: hypothetical protein AAFO72_12410, partial [Pseudomonadota bacterium]
MVAVISFTETTAKEIFDNPLFLILIASLTIYFSNKGVAAQMEQQLEVADENRSRRLWSLHGKLALASAEATQNIQEIVEWYAYERNGPVPDTAKFDRNVGIFAEYVEHCRIENANVIVTML